MAINLSQIEKLLLPGLMGLTGKYDMIPKQWGEVYTTVTSKMAFERHVEMRYLGTAQLKDEGGQFAFDNAAGQRYTYNQEHMEVGLGFAITEKTIEDNLYKAQFGPSVMGLNESFAQTKEIYGADVFNNANVYDPDVGGDGKALCATDHPLDGGRTLANRPSTDLDLNESSLITVNTAIRTDWRDQAGLKIMARARKLVIPPALIAVAERLIYSDYRPGTANNDVNVLKSKTNSLGLTEGYTVLDFLTSTRAWFVLTNIRTLLHMQRIGYKTSMHTDFFTNNLFVKGRERYSFGYKGYRGIYGSFPS